VVGGHENHALRLANIRYARTNLPYLVSVPTLHINASRTGRKGRCGEHRAVVDHDIHYLEDGGDL
jgi:hypothetical protein